MGSRLGRLLGVALVAGPGACVLYTEPINSPPGVPMIVAPTEIVTGKAAQFRAEVRDPDGDPVELSWSEIAKGCAEVREDEWAVVPSKVGATFQTFPPRRQLFCLRVVARDAHGALGRPSAPQEFTAVNRRPTAVLQLVAPTGPGPFPLHGSFRFSAEKSDDLDGDPLQFEWRARDGSAAEVSLGDCGAGKPDRIRCFGAERSGEYAVSVTVSDGAESHEQTLPVRVAEDQPPCIDLTDPPIGTETVVLAIDDRPRAFEVRRVSDDGEPFPPGPRGGSRFYWSTAREGGAWQRQLLPTDRARFDVGADLFDDRRPGSRMRVRVEARDSERDAAPALASLRASCEDRSLCEQPPRCVRWVTWTVELR